MKLSETTKKIITWVLILISIAAIVTAIVVPIIVITNRKNSFKYYPDLGSQKIENDTENYINKNEMSLLFYAVPKANYPVELMSNVIKNNGGNEANIFEFLNPNIASITSGTSWMFDYQIDSKNSNLVTYYLATNIHVINLSYSAIYNLPNDITVNVTIPINSTTSNSISAYVSQPLGKYGNNDGLTSISNVVEAYNYAWFKLPDFSLSTASQNLIPLGALSNENVSESNKYLAQISVTESNNKVADYFVDSDYKVSKTIFPTRNSGTESQDFGLVKTQISTNEKILPQNSNLIDNSSELRLSFENMQNIFNIDKTFDSRNPLNNSYITKLNYLNQNINSITKEEFENNFMFSLMSNLSNDDEISVAGYPGGTNSTSQTSYTYYNGATFKKSDVSEVEGSINRPSIQFNYNGNLMSVPYDQTDNYKAGGVNLQPGSSGSMVVNKNGQILGIYWGIVTQSRGNESTNYGMITPIMTTDGPIKSTTNLLIKYYLYQTHYNNNTELVKLFNSIKSRMNQSQ